MIIYRLSGKINIVKDFTNLLPQKYLDENLLQAAAVELIPVTLWAGVGKVQTFIENKN